MYCTDIHIRRYAISVGIQTCTMCVRIMCQCCTTCVHVYIKCVYVCIVCELLCVCLEAPCMHCQAAVPVGKDL